MRIIAAIDDSAAASQVIDTALSLAELLAVDVHALHARIEGEAEVARRAGALAAARGVDFKVVDGDPTATLVAAFIADDVLLGVIGARGRPGGKRPAGHTALAVATGSEKAVVVTPPDARVHVIHRLLLPLEGRTAGTMAVSNLVALLADSGVTVVPLHVFTPANVPSFWDQPQHAAAAWSAEFLDRFGAGPGDQLWLRCGNVADATVDIMHREAIDLVALAWSQNLAGTHAPTVRAILADSSVPVLLIPVEPLDTAAQRTGSRA
jgi:nucleotide-binding universal stress UspA family protein